MRTDGRTDGRGIPNLLHSLTPDDQIMIRRRVKKQHARPGRRHRRQISNSHALANDLRQLERKKAGRVSSWIPGLVNGIYVCRALFHKCGLSLRPLISLKIRIPPSFQDPPAGES